MFGLFKRSRPGAPQLPPLRRDQLVPRIKHTEFVRTLDRAGVPLAQRPAFTPLCGDLLVTYAFDLPDSFVMATGPLLEQAGIDPDDMARLAIGNLADSLPESKFYASRGCGLAHVGGDLEATLLLVDSVWDAIVPDVSGELVASAPRRNRLLVCDSANSDALAQLRAQSQEFFVEEDDHHALSTQLMVRRGARWVLFDR